MLKLAAAAIVLTFQAPDQGRQQPQPPKPEFEFYIKVEVQGPLALSSDPTKTNIAYIRYGEGFARQEVLLKWSEEDKKLTQRVKELQGKWVVARGRMEIGVPPEVRLESIKKSSDSVKELSKP
jgi:hypothetical protein